MDRGFELALGFILAEVLVEQVAEEFVGERSGRLGCQSAGDLAEQGDVASGGLTEELLLAENVGVGELAPSGVISASPSCDVEEAEQGSGFDDGEQVVDFEGEVVGEAVNVVAAVRGRRSVRAGRRCRRAGRAEASGTWRAGRARRGRLRLGSGAGTRSGWVRTL